MSDDTTNQPGITHSPMGEVAKAPFQLSAADLIKASDDPGTWSATVLEYHEHRESRDVDQSFMDYYMGGGQMVQIGQEVKLFVTGIRHDEKRVTVTMDYRPVPAVVYSGGQAGFAPREDSAISTRTQLDAAPATASAVPAPREAAELESLQRWLVALASGAASTQQRFDAFRLWTNALAAVTGLAVPKGWEY